jgi:hypothetical protein
MWWMGAGVLERGLVSFNLKNLLKFKRRSKVPLWSLDVVRFHHLFKQQDLIPDFHRSSPLNSLVFYWTSSL